MAERIFFTGGVTYFGLEYVEDLSGVVGSTRVFLAGLESMMSSGSETQTSPSSSAMGMRGFDLVGEGEAIGTTGRRKDFVVAGEKIPGRVKSTD